MKRQLSTLVGSLTLGAALSLGALTAQAAPPSQLQCPDGQNIVVHLKRHMDDLQGAHIAVRLATLMESQEIPGPGNSKSKPVNVILFLTLQGPRLIDPAQPQALLFGKMTGTLENVVKGFLGAGGTIYACPLCAEEIGLLPGDELLYQLTYPDQVKIASRDDLIRIFLCADKILDF